ncbi:MAG: extracellular solute-binding protein [Deltaproteobacteria bacterium]|nr:extracellular solute-binding protein [Deltaproteobacteria bacterium]MBW1995910.1 extracellular solute-binding protein [Deltaproteobacteria bacterium]MBW2153195.1 extracellular solute-binding protein [Deltaproteobacteria bacterium]
MRKQRFNYCLWTVGAMLLAIFVAMPYHANALEDKLVIVTSYPKDLTGPFKKAFEARHPGVKVEVLQKKTSAAVKYIQETAQGNTSDLMWASAPDAFEVLKGDGLLARYTPKAKGIPKYIGSYPINDPDGYYIGFAASGYGIMWNKRYLKAKKIPVPKEWEDLKNPVYHGHVGMSAPSRSGTTHLTVETVLQGEGWEKGWATWKEIGGNLKMVTERSFGVPEGVNSGDFGVGIVIDFFGFSSKATGFPVDFVYPTVTTLVPANIAIVKDAPHPQAAAAFIEFLLSIEGQELLLDPAIRRLPVNPATYAKAPKDFPNPFKDKSIGAAVKFDVQLSKSRYNIVNSLFDVMITYRRQDLAKAVKAIQDAEAALTGKSNQQAVALIKEARALVAAVPISEAEAVDAKYPGVFTSDVFKKRKKPGVKVPPRQAEVEEKWDAFTKKNYAEAAKKAKKALAVLK